MWKHDANDSEPLYSSTWRIDGLHARDDVVFEVFHEEEKYFFKNIALNSHHFSNMQHVPNQQYLYIQTLNIPEYQKTSPNFEYIAKKKLSIMSL